MSIKSPDVSGHIRTCLVNGFHLDGAIRSVGHVILELHKYGQFGERIDYSIAIFESSPPSAAVAAFIKSAEHSHRQPILVSPPGKFPCIQLSSDEFFSTLGGPIDYALLLEHDLPERLEKLGLNQGWPGLLKSPEDALEDYAKASLEFMLANRAHKWGIDRRFEPLPDGVALGPNNIVLLYDAKAYSGGYSVTADDVRRFRDYIDDFHIKYVEYLGRVHSFVVISGLFNQDEDQMAARSADLYANCQVLLSFLKARTLGDIVQLLLSHTQMRNAVGWKDIFSKTEVTIEDVRRQVESLLKDKLLRGT